MLMLLNFTLALENDLIHILSLFLKLSDSFVDPSEGILK